MLHPPEPEEVRREPWRLLVLLVGMSAIGPLSLNILVPAVPGLVLQLASDAATVQLTMSLYLFGLAFSQLALGPLSDRFGRRPVLLAGLAITAVTSIAAVAATSIVGLIVARTAQSFGASTGLVVGRAMIRDLYERDRAASMIGWVTMGIIVAPMVAPLIGGILDTAFGWHSIFIFVAGASVLVLIWAIIELPETRAVHAMEPARLWHEVRALATTPSFFGYVLAAGLGSAPFFIFLGGSPHAVITIMGHSSAVYGAWFAINSVGYMAGNFAAARFSQRYGVNAMVWWGTVIGVVGAVISCVPAWLVPHWGPAIIFVPQLIMSIGNGVLLPNAIAGAVSVRPEAAGTASGVTGFVQMAIGAGAVQFGSHVLTGASTPLPMAIAMLVSAVATGVAFALLVRRGEAR
jgi:DHA1 family bicyclomycin/chloramphenicol resistance-like MFS transporter